MVTPPAVCVRLTVLKLEHLKLATFDHPQLNVEDRSKIVGSASERLVRVSESVIQIGSYVTRGVLVDICSEWECVVRRGLGVDKTGSDFTGAKCISENILPLRARISCV